MEPARIVRAVIPEPGDDGRNPATLRAKVEVLTLVVTQEGTLRAIVVEKRDIFRNHLSDPHNDEIDHLALVDVEAPILMVPLQLHQHGEHGIPCL